MVACFGNGTTQTLTEICRQAFIKIGEYTCRPTLFVADLPGHDLIFGKAWLSEANPRINWKNNQVIISQPGKDILLPTTFSKPKAKIEHISAIQLKKILRKPNQEAFLCTIKEIPADQEIPKELEELL